MSRLQKQLWKWMETSDFTPYIYLGTSKERQILYEFLVHHNFRWSEHGNLVKDTECVLLGYNCKCVMPVGLKRDKERRLAWASNLPDPTDWENWARYYGDSFRELDIRQFLRLCRDIQTTDICG